jgi:hypothetical protein
MRRLMLIAGTLALLGACSSGGCDAGGGKSSEPAKEAPTLGGGSPHGGTGETISFQGLGKGAPPPGMSQATSSAAAALGGSAPLDPAQTVICGGFPNLLPDCKTDPAYAALKQKCCPTGTVDQCVAVPGGARLIGHACSAQASTSAPAH